MFDLFYVALAAAGYFVYTQIATEPSPQTQAEHAKISLVPQPRKLYTPLNKFLLQERPRVSVAGRSTDQGWLGTPRYDIRNEVTGTITPIYSTEINRTLDVIKI